MSPDEQIAATLRERLVERHIRARGISDERLLDVIRALPRERFIPGASLQDAYGDHPVSIGAGQTISQPYMVAWMTDALRLQPTDRVLEVGTGSGYQTAVLSALVSEVYTVEYLASLSEKAEALLSNMGCRNIRFRQGDGTLGWPEAAPFDAICVTAGAPAAPPSLLAQLAEGGRMVIPVGDRFVQQLLLITKQGGQVTEQSLGGCRFVPLLGAEGWSLDAM
ncbi:MAG: protein-L-isoaspartate(D-aspartate) O-methyltransferase [Spartobacteria bacterium]|nr:protein-L-isoaspartate(D-aspartate) O-methyltransferase [Spartobacteria bacterium]